MEQKTPHNDEWPKAGNIDLHSTMDAEVWSGEFCRIVGEKIPALRDEQDWMLGWFANAIMAGYDAAKREAEAS